jgi:hypothetical protein
MWYNSVKHVGPYCVCKAGPHKYFPKFDAMHDEMGVCTICLDHFVESVEVTYMPCKHVFHGDCITKWLKNSNTFAPSADLRCLFMILVSNYSGQVVHCEELGSSMKKSARTFTHRHRKGRRIFFFIFFSLF